LAKVFISSVIEGFKEFRHAAKEAVETVGMTPIMAENLPALPYSSDKACIVGVQESELLILILGERYGHEIEPGISATRAEYLEARKLHKDILIFVQTEVEMEDKQAEFRKEIENYSGGFHRDSFSTPENLKDCISRSLNEWKDSQASISDAIFKDRIRAELPQHPPSQESFTFAGGGFIYPWAVVAFWGQPTQTPDLKDIEIENEFKKLCEINATLSGGYDSPRKSNNCLSFTYPRMTHNHSEHICSEIRYYDDGLILLHFIPATEFGGGLVSYILAKEFTRTVENSWSLNRANSSWAFVGLYNVGGALYFDKPASQTPPRQSADTAIEDCKFFNPMRKEAYLKWVEEWVKKVKRKFSYSEFSAY